MQTFVYQQSDAQIQAILNKIQPLVDTGSTAPLGFGYGVCETAGATAAKTVSLTNTIRTLDNSMKVTVLVTQLATTKRLLVTAQNHIVCTASGNLVRIANN
jgi:hypothetical protein